MDAVCVRPARGAWDRNMRVGPGCGCSDTLAIKLKLTDGRKRMVAFIIAVNLTSQATRRSDTRSAPRRLPAHSASSDAEYQNTKRVGRIRLSVLRNTGQFENL